MILSNLEQRQQNDCLRLLRVAGGAWFAVGERDLRDAGNDIARPAWSGRWRRQADPRFTASADLHTCLTEPEQNRRRTRTAKQCRGLEGGAAAAYIWESSDAACHSDAAQTR